MVESSPHGRIMCEQGHGSVAVDEQHEHGAAAQADKQALAAGRAAHAAHIPHGRVQRPLARRVAVPVNAPPSGTPDYPADATTWMTCLAWLLMHQ